MLGRFLKSLAAGAMAAAIGLGSVGCADINIDVRGFRKFWTDSRLTEPRSPDIQPTAAADGEARGETDVAGRS